MIEKEMAEQLFIDMHKNPLIWLEIFKKEGITITMQEYAIESAKIFYKKYVKARSEAHATFSINEPLARNNTPFTVRTTNCLLDLGSKTINDIKQLLDTNNLNLKTLGVKSMKEIKDYFYSPCNT